MRPKLRVLYLRLFQLGFKNTIMLNGEIGDAVNIHKTRMPYLISDGGEERERYPDHMSNDARASGQLSLPALVHGQKCTYTKKVDDIGGVVAVAFGCCFAIVVTRDCSVFGIGYTVSKPFRWPNDRNTHTKMMQLIP